MICIYKNPNPEQEKELEDNDGYCPCAVVKDEDTKCMCKSFREMKTGTCMCGLYTKENSKYPLDDPNEKRQAGLTTEE